MKKNRKDVKATTDDGRTILGKDRREEPRSAKANWKLWKEIQNLTPNDLEALFSIYKKRFNDKNNADCRNEIGRDLLIINDARRIRKRELEEERRRKKEPIDIYFDGESSIVRVIHDDGRQDMYSVGLNEDETKLVTFSSTTIAQPTFYKTVSSVEEEEEDKDMPFDRDIDYKEWAYEVNIDKDGDSIEYSGSFDDMDIQKDEIEEIRKKQKEKEERDKEELRLKRHRETQKRYSEKKRGEKQT